jgi:hypothetical protein
MMDPEKQEVRRDYLDAIVLIRAMMPGFPDRFTGTGPNGPASVAGEAYISRLSRSEISSKIRL